MVLSDCNWTNGLVSSFLGSHKLFPTFIFYMFQMHCVKSVRIRSYSGPYFLAFGLNKERDSVYFRIQFECGKLRTRVTPNTDTFCAVLVTIILYWLV